MPKLRVVSRLRAVRRTVATLFVLCAVPAVAPASTIILVPPSPPAAVGLDLVVLDVDREIDAHGSSYCSGCSGYANGQNQHSDEVGHFDGYANSVGSGAYQDSMVSSDELSGRGGIDFGYSDESSALSSLSVEFQVATTGTYGMLGEFEVFSFVDTSYIELLGPGGTIFHENGYGSGTFEESFQLLEGQSYTLNALIEGYGGGTPGGGSWSFTIVPEPGTGMLLAAGLAGVAGRSRGRALLRWSASATTSR